VHKRDITAEVAARLVAGQFPQWADLPVVPVALDGWDNTTFRLGDDLSVRLPSHDAYVAQIDKERRWLPRLAPQLPNPIPEPVARGAPSSEFPRPWSIYRWISGDTATVDRIPDPTTFAAELAGFLGALYAIDAHDGPPAGPHSFARGGPVAVWDAQTRTAIDRWSATIDGSGATEVWDAAVSSVWDREPVWVHGDVTGSNLLVEDGRLCAVIDFGCCAVGDPACDLVIAWNLFEGESRRTFRRALPFDDATWQRARGWALWKALIELVAEDEGRVGPGSAARRFGWRGDARAIIDIVVADHHAARPHPAGEL
jgi:aminoglycoside phosphotransferase (APT) family kinase protein